MTTILMFLNMPTKKPRNKCNSMMGACTLNALELTKFALL